jgi:hypothetical protein
LEAPQAVGTIDGISIQNVVATMAGRIGCSISGIPGHNVENVSLSNLSLEFDGLRHVEAVPVSPPENLDHYPEGTMFGVLPSFGLYCRHASGLVLSNVRLDTHDAFEMRSALVMDDVIETTITGFSRTRKVASPADIGLINAKEILIQGCRPRGISRFVNVFGEGSSGISLLGNDFSGIPWGARSEPGVSPTAIKMTGNLVNTPVVD